jgi:hypothetical protein
MAAMAIDKDEIEEAWAIEVERRIAEFENPQISRHRLR